MVPLNPAMKNKICANAYGREIFANYKEAHPRKGLLGTFISDQTERKPTTEWGDKHLIYYINHSLDTLRLS